ncbi:hypothetical protein KPG66_16230 [Mycetohabitans sp. B2]|jgi:hypothetical protein|uniref:hypothetical protein n=1 Tax=Mycetohabitans sp. B2 TaxID=2841274 RepID=UPI001F2CEA89|nr:hypothetical protein [Mycetohabitans sp. B2]MCF7697524.1 hypothetical protein [Mycetohabitans sp. B2]
MGGFTDKIKHGTEIAGTGTGAFNYGKTGTQIAGTSAAGNTAMDGVAHEIEQTEQHAGLLNFRMNLATLFKEICSHQM